MNLVPHPLGKDWISSLAMGWEKYFLGRENYILYILLLFGRYYIRRVLERNGLNQAVIQIPVNISQKAILGILKPKSKNCTTANLKYRPLEWLTSLS